MGALAHYLENEGFSTTQISLIRQHTEIIKPPRALWVPFELGRPLGAPNDPAFQTRVLRRVLKLLEASEGPVLEDFTEDAPSFSGSIGLLSCPVDLQGMEVDVKESDRFVAAFKEEVMQMRNWYDLALVNRRRTTASVSDLEPNVAAEFVAAFAMDHNVESPIPGLSSAMALKLAIEDLKAYYFEAVTAQAGQPTDSMSLANWFWSQTLAAKAINAARETCLASGKKELKIFGELLLVPKNQMHRFSRDGRKSADMKSIVGICGLYCGTCPIYLAHRKNDIDQLRKLSEETGVPIEKIYCDGCLSSNVFSRCADCRHGFRQCAIENKVTWCFQCPHFPCKRLSDFRDAHVVDGISHHAHVIDDLQSMKEQGIEKWVERQSREARCSKCGTVLYWFARECSKCHAQVRRSPSPKGESSC